MSPPKKAAQPIREVFDAWNSSSTGHQTSPSQLAGTTSWRESRSLKLRGQFLGGGGGGKRVSDTVGAGSEGCRQDGRRLNGGWMPGVAGLRERGQKTIVETMRECKRRKIGVERRETKMDTAEESRRDKDLVDSETVKVDDTQPSRNQDQAGEDGQQLRNCKKIFEGLCVYINGSTAPAVSDHKLKFLLCERGARISIALGRRSVTHVILGTPNHQKGCGGGLAATKIQKEVARVGGKGIKFVGVDWVLESIKAEKRLPESRFANLHLALKGQRSVLDTLK